MQLSDRDSVLYRKTGQPDHPGDAGQLEAVQKFRPFLLASKPGPGQIGSQQIFELAANIAIVLEKLQPYALVPAPDRRHRQSVRQQAQLFRTAHQSQVRAGILRRHGLQSRPGQQDVAQGPLVPDKDIFRFRRQKAALVADLWLVTCFIFDCLTSRMLK